MANINLKDFINNPNINPAIKKQLEGELEKEEDSKEKFLFIIEDYHPISIKDHKQFFYFTVAIIVIIFIFVWIIT